MTVHKSLWRPSEQSEGTQFDKFEQENERESETQSVKGRVHITGVVVINNGTFQVGPTTLKISDRILGPIYG